MAIGLGIDTGGTYTDSVIMDMDTGRIVGRSKALTTRFDLVVGIRESIKGLPSVKGISMVSLSSTLATNSIVEGKSCRVGLITIGKEAKITITPACYAYLDAEIDLRGNVLKDLDEAEARSVLLSMKGKIDVLAIAGYLSVRYPLHENRIRELSDELLGVPVVCAHDLTSKLGHTPRTNTAVINASLIPVTIELIKAVREVLDEFGISAPLMIVRGDGSMMNVDTAVKRPIETIMSGPASSMTCAMRTSGLPDALVVDIGGTTTDIGVIKSGFIHTLDSGAVIGGHMTRVRAADLSTYGVGGDSHIQLSSGALEITPTRVIPLCVSSLSNPKIADAVADGQIYFFIRASNCITDGLSNKEIKILGSLSNVPKSLADIVSETGLDADIGMLEHLQSTGHVTGIGLTPTDVLSAEKELDIYDSKAASIAVDAVCKTMGIGRCEFISAVKSMMVSKIRSAVIDHVSRERINDCVKDTFYEGLFDGSRLKIPIVGVGAPAKAWLPKVAESLGSELILSENYDVGNAIGAISSSVMEYAEIYIRAFPKDMNEDPHCRVFAGEDCFTFDCRKDAMDFALMKGEEISRSRADSSGAGNISTQYTVKESYIDYEGKGIHIFRGADIIFRAYGRPVF